MADAIITTDDAGIQWLQVTNPDGSTTSYRLTPRASRPLLTPRPVQPITRKPTYQGAPEGYGPKPSGSDHATPLIRKTPTPSVPRPNRFASPQRPTRASVLNRKNQHD